MPTVSNTDQQPEKAPGRAGRPLALLVGSLLALAALIVGAPVAAQDTVGPQPQILVFTIGPGTTTQQVSTGGHSPLLPPTAVATSVAAKTADDWPVISGIVRDASRSKGNFGLDSGTRKPIGNGHFDVTDMFP